jgi:hypothetical protein
LEHDSAEALAKQIQELLPVDDEAKQRKQFTKIVDALVATDLEHKYEELFKIAGQQGEDERPAKAAKANADDE